MKIKPVVHIKTGYPFSLREKVRMRGYKIRQLTTCFPPLSPTLSATAPCVALPPTSLSASRRERELVEEPQS
jgi:hypothetical protein